MKDQLEELCREIDRILTEAGEIGAIASGELVVGSHIDLNLSFPLLKLQQILTQLMITYPDCGWVVSENRITALLNGARVGEVKLSTVHRLPYTAPTPRNK